MKGVGDLRFKRDGFQERPVTVFISVGIKRYRRYYCGIYSWYNFIDFFLWSGVLLY